MNRISLAALLGSAALLSACQPQPSKNAGGTSDIERGRTVTPQQPPAAPTPPPAPSLSVSAPSPSGENDGYPDLTPAPLTGEAIRSEKGARSILLAWARAIELREFDQSWAMMSGRAKAQTSKAQFNALFHPLRDIAVAIDPGTSEGAAGSIYYTVPATVTGTRGDGSKATLTGEVVMRRVNDIDGATAAQLAWHIVSVGLDPA